MIRGLNRHRAFKRSIKSGSLSVLLGKLCRSVESIAILCVAEFYIFCSDKHGVIEITAAIGITLENVIFCQSVCSASIGFNLDALTAG